MFLRQKETRPPTTAGVAVANPAFSHSQWASAQAAATRDGGCGRVLDTITATSSYAPAPNRTHGGIGQNFDVAGWTSGGYQNHHAAHGRQVSRPTIPVVQPTHLKSDRSSFCSSGSESSTSVSHSGTLCVSHEKSCEDNRWARTRRDGAGSCYAYTGSDTYPTEVSTGWSQFSSRSTQNSQTCPSRPSKNGCHVSSSLGGSVVPERASHRHSHHSNAAYTYNPSTGTQAQDLDSAKRQTRHTTHHDHNRRSRQSRRTTRSTRPTSSNRSQTSASSNNAMPTTAQRGSSSTRGSSRSSQSSSSQQRQRVWKAAVDPKSGRTYYYDAVTRETQWRKPIELATPAERAAMAAKEKKQKDFFSAMEANILRSMAQGNLNPVSGSDEEADEVGDMPQPTEMKRAWSRGGPALERPKMVRTISSMDDALLAELTRVESQNPSPNSVTVAGGSDTSGPFAIPPMTTAKDSLESKSSFDDVALGDENEQSMAIERLRRVADEMARSSQVGASIALAAESVSSGGSPTGASSPSRSESKSPPPSSGDLRGLAKPNLAKRNTCGTLYVGSTMSAPDKDATIKCVCGVYRAHLLQSAREEASQTSISGIKFEEYEVFNDHPDRRQSFVQSTSSLEVPKMERVIIQHGSGSAESDVSIEALSLESAEAAVPSLDAITNFYRDVFRRSQMESDCIIMSLIYVERLIKATNGGVRPRVSNWRSILFSSMIMSSKVWDDLSMWNADFSQTCPAGVTFSLQRINELELAMLGCLKYNVKVLASEYAKYYFLLRSMLIKSGLADTHDITSMSPLDVEGAKKLEHVSGIFESSNDMSFSKLSPLHASRSKSVGEVEDQLGQSLNSLGEGGSGGGSPKTTPKVSLEHVVHM